MPLVVRIASPQWKSQEENRIVYLSSWIEMSTALVGLGLWLQSFTDIYKAIISPLGDAMQYYRSQAMSSDVYRLCALTVRTVVIHKCANCWKVFNSSPWRPQRYWSLWWRPQNTPESISFRDRDFKQGYVGRNVWCSLHLLLMLIKHSFLLSGICWRGTWRKYSRSRCRRNRRWRNGRWKTIGPWTYHHGHAAATQ